MFFFSFAYQFWLCEQEKAGVKRANRRDRKYTQREGARVGSNSALRLHCHNQSSRTKCSLLSGTSTGLRNCSFNSFLWWPYHFLSSSLGVCTMPGSGRVALETSEQIWGTHRFSGRRSPTLHPESASVIIINSKFSLTLDIIVVRKHLNASFFFILQ